MSHVLNKIKTYFIRRFKKVAVAKLKKQKAKYLESRETLAEYVHYQLLVFDPSAFVGSIRALTSNAKLTARHNCVPAMVLEIAQVNKCLEKRQNLKQILTQAGMHKTQALEFLSDLDGCYSTTSTEELRELCEHIETLLGAYRKAISVKETSDLNNTYLMGTYIRELCEILDNWLEFQ